jgi:hypothetical protein
MRARYWIGTLGLGIWAKSPGASIAPRVVTSTRTVFISCSTFLELVLPRILRNHQGTTCVNGTFGAVVRLRYQATVNPVEEA